MSDLGMLLPCAFQVGAQPMRNGTQAVFVQFDFAPIILELGRLKLVYLYVDYAKTQ